MEKQLLLLALCLSIFFTGTYASEAAAKEEKKEEVKDSIKPFQYVSYFSKIDSLKKIRKDLYVKANETTENEAKVEVLNSIVEFDQSFVDLSEKINSEFFETQSKLENANKSEKITDKNGEKAKKFHDILFYSLIGLGSLLVIILFVLLKSKKTVKKITLEKLNSEDSNNTLKKEIEEKAKEIEEKLKNIEELNAKIDKQKQDFDNLNNENDKRIEPLTNKTRLLEENVQRLQKEKIAYAKKYTDLKVEFARNRQSTTNTAAVAHQLHPDSQKRYSEMEINLSKLERLGQLMEMGMITESEFDELKKNVLSQL